MHIPVFHDDQHGTAIIVGAALLNALILVNKRIEDVKVICNGGGAASIACAEHAIQLGMKLENIIMCDIAGVVYKGSRAKDQVIAVLTVVGTFVLLALRSRRPNCIR